MTPTALADCTPISTLLIGFPTREDTWREQGRPAQASIRAFISQLLHHTDVTLYMVVDTTNKQHAQTVLTKLNNTRVKLLELEMDDCWIRDTGPVLLSNGRGVCFSFNAWGGVCYTECSRDRTVSRSICKRFNLEVVQERTVLEGGAISSDGEGTLLASMECILNKNRGNGSMEQVERRLKETLGIRKIIWLEYGANYDTDTSGHVDNMAVFLRPGVVLLTWADENEDKEQWRRSTLALHRLQTSRDACGRTLEIVKIRAAQVIRTVQEAGQVVKQAGVKRRPVGEQVCASYTNVVLVNNVVFIPCFGETEADEAARVAVQNVFDGKVVQVGCREFVLSGGGLHCITLGIMEAARG